MEYIELGKILEYEQPTQYLVETTNYRNDYNIPVLTAGQTFILGYTNETYNVFPVSRLPVIIFDDFTTASKFVDFPFKVKSTAMKILNPVKGINVKYVYYAMQKIKFDNTLHKRYWISQYANIKIPLPEIEKQNKIADEIDRITEIILYKKEQLKILDDLVKSQFVEMFENEKYPKKTLNELTNKITDGSHNPPTGVAENEGYMMLSSQNIINNSLNYEKVRFLKKEDFEKENLRTNLNRGDVLLTIVGTVGRTAIITDETNITLQRSVAVLKPTKEINSIYLVGAINSDDVIRQLNKGAKGVAQKAIYLNDIKKILIAVPPIELQNQFADIVKQIDKQKFEIENSLKEMQELYESLMEKYFG